MYRRTSRLNRRSAWRYELAISNLLSDQRSSAGALEIDQKAQHLPRRAPVQDALVRFILLDQLQQLRADGRMDAPDHRGELPGLRQHRAIFRQIGPWLKRILDLALIAP